MVKGVMGKCAVQFCVLIGGFHMISSYSGLHTTLLVKICKLSESGIDKLQF